MRTEIFRYERQFKKNKKRKTRKGKQNGAKRKGEQEQKEKCKKRCVDGQQGKVEWQKGKKTVNNTTQHEGEKIKEKRRIKAK